MRAPVVDDLVAGKQQLQDAAQHLRLMGAPPAGSVDVAQVDAHAHVQVGAAQRLQKCGRHAVHQRDHHAIHMLPAQQLCMSM